MNRRDIINIPPQPPKTDQFERWNWANNHIDNIELVPSSGQFEELPVSEAVSENIFGFRRVE